MILAFDCMIDCVCMIVIDIIVEKYGIPVPNDGPFGSEMIGKALRQFEQKPTRFEIQSCILCWSCSSILASSVWLH